MARKYIPKAIRIEVADRATGYCEYCKFLQKYSPDPFTCEHIIPLAHGGTDELDNLAHSCIGCNAAKHTAITAIDPETDQVVPLFHPRKEAWSTHFTWAENTLEIVGRTAIGRATIAKLKTNRAALIHFRRLLLLTGEHPPK